jgi:hypothetical protein
VLHGVVEAFVPDDGLMAGARLQGTGACGLNLPNRRQRISCSFSWVGWALANLEGFLTDHTYITCTVQCFTGGMVDTEVHASEW